MHEWYLVYSNLSVYNLTIPSQLLIQLSIDLLLTTIYSQHGFKSWTLRNVASWGYGRIMSHFELISAHVMKFLYVCHTFPHTRSDLFAYFLIENQKTSIFPTSFQQLDSISGWTPTNLLQWYLHWLALRHSYWQNIHICSSQWCF